MSNTHGQLGAWGRHPRVGRKDLELRGVEGTPTLPGRGIPNLAETQVGTKKNGRTGKDAKHRENEPESLLCPCANSRLGQFLKEAPDQKQGGGTTVKGVRGGSLRRQG